MNFAIVFFVGCLTVVFVMLLKIPIKKVSHRLAEYSFGDTETEVMYKRYNLMIFVLVFVVSCILYYFVLQWLGETHFKFCYALKAGVIAIALYSVFERFM